MEDLIEITKSKGGKEVVSGLDIYNYLKIKTRFDKWMNRMIAYGFAESVDYQRLVKFDQMQNGGSREILSDYAVTLDMAKHISMIQRTSEGMQLRQYFIDRENKLREIEKGKTPTLPLTYIESLEKLLESEKGKLLLENKIEEQKPKVEYYEKVLASDQTYTTTQIAALIGKSAVWLNKYLVSMKVQYKHRSGYILHAIYKDKGYDFIRTSIYESNGVSHTRQQLEWTEKGKLFVMTMVNNKLLGK